MPTDPIVSHGRGGAGNIARDENSYVDGEIVREGPVGDQGDGAYSTGRGGAGNIDSPGLRPKNHTTGDTDVIPETATKPVGQYETFHTGRGGEGNVHREQKEHTGGEHEGLKEKAKHLFGGGHHEGRKEGV